MVPSLATAMPLRVMISEVLRSSWAEVAAAPSPMEPTSPMPAIETSDLEIAAAATAVVLVAGATSEKTRSGLSTDVTTSFSAADGTVAAGTDLEICSADGGATARVRRPMLVATMVGAMPFEALGAIAIVAGAVDDGVAAVAVEAGA